MYKVEIKIGDWDFLEDEVVTIETSDFEKAQIIQEFIEFQQAYGWAVDYEAVEEFDDEDEGVEFGEDEEYVYDEETDAWYWYDEELDTWYVYDEESDDWIEYIEYVEEDETATVTSFVITRIEE